MLKKSRDEVHSIVERKSREDPIIDIRKVGNIAINYRLPINSSNPRFERLAAAGENCLQEGEEFIESECLMIQRDFQRWVSDSSSNSGTGAEARQPEITPQALL